MRVVHAMDLTLCLRISVVVLLIEEYRDGGILLHFHFIFYWLCELTGINLRKAKAL